LRAQRVDILNEAAGERGQLQTIRELIWPTFAAGLGQRNIGVVALAFDLVVPPLFILGLLALGSIPFWLSVLSSLVFVATLGVAWRAVGQDLVSIGKFGAFAGFALSKMSLYRQIFRSGTDRRWVRTDRGNPEDGRGGDGGQTRLSDSDPGR
jgi:hypothetical protein